MIYQVKYAISFVSICNQKYKDVVVVVKHDLQMITLGKKRKALDHEDLVINKTTVPSKVTTLQYIHI